MYDKIIAEIAKLPYINLIAEEKIIKDYSGEYKHIKARFWKSEDDKKFLKYYPKISEYIDEHNNEYLKELRTKTKILDNINGYPLDEYQSRVVLSDEIATLVVAGAGAGKSMTIIGKIVYLIEELKVQKEDILIISFTNDATINLKNNLKKNYNYDLEIYTFHKLALKILKENNEEYEIAPDNYLEQLIDDFFNNDCYGNALLQGALKKLTKNKYELKNIKMTVATFISLYKSNNYSIHYLKDITKRLKINFHLHERKTNLNLFLLIVNIYLLYENNLKTEQALDFNDMINKCITSLKTKGLTKTWQYIIIDEYQDTSLTKYEMINEIIALTNAKLLVVGDDFQSIYRFTGCNLNIFLNFSSNIKYSKIFQIINTYRNPQELIDVAGSFVMRNKKQQRKNLISPKHLTKPIKIIETNNPLVSLKKSLEALSLISETIYVLGRNNKDINYYIDETFKKEDDNYYYKGIKFRYLTIHKSKGLEADNVILINVTNRLTGLPTKLKNEPILKYVNNDKDYYPFEEERRLFYVALTRTKNYCLIIDELTRESIFIKEIKKDVKNVEIIKSNRAINIPKP